MISLDCSGSEICNFRSPQKDQELNMDGAQNFIIKARIKRISGNNWRGKILWTGHIPMGRGNEVTFPHLNGVDQALLMPELVTRAIIYQESSARQMQIPEPANLDNDFVIVQWDMSEVDENGNSLVPSWKKSIIHQINIQFEEDSPSKYYIDWVEIGGKTPVKYQDGQLKFPLRTNESTKRLKGTWAKVKYRAKTTDKFNIFAILAKYRKTY